MVATPTRLRRKQQGLCPDCGEEPAPGFKSCLPCLDRSRQKTRRHLERCKTRGNCVCGTPLPDGFKQCDHCREKKRERVVERKAAGVCSVCRGEVVAGKSLCSRCAGRGKITSKGTRRRLKETVFAHYGAACVCCGETTYEFLTIDHVDGGGTKHRKELGSGHSVYRWLIQNDYPDGYQVLCFNCNCAKGFHKECPHERMRRESRG